MGKIYGYICGLPGKIDVNKQKDLMYEMQVADKDIYIDHRENSTRVKEQYQNLLGKLKAGDLIYIKELGSLGDSYGEVGIQLRVLTKEKKADVAVLDMPQIDTRRGKIQCGTLVEDVVLSMLEYADSAEWFMRKQKEGIERARSRGVQFGRPELAMPGNFEEIYRMWRRKEIKGEEAAEMCHISRASFYKRASLKKKLETAEIYAVGTGCGEILRYGKEE